MSVQLHQACFYTVLYDSQCSVHYLNSSSIVPLSITGLCNRGEAVVNARGRRRWYTETLFKACNSITDRDHNTLIL
jgi:hypothetical protein